MPDAVLVSGRMMCNRSVRYLHVFDLKPANALSPEWRLNLFDANGILDWSVFVGIRDLIFGLDEPYRRLLATILTTTAGQAFFAGPSSLHDHHHEAGGNARHALHVATLALGMLAECDALVDRNLVLALALLHDIGKTTEYEATQNGRWQMSSAGRLIGHRMSGLVAVAREIRQAGLSAEAELSLLHGLSACQAPKYVGLRGPASLEALIVGAADGVSRYMDLFSQSYRPGKSFGDRHPHLAERPHFPVVAVHRLAHHAS
jgi:3'-5' exoribonuclease